MVVHGITVNDFSVTCNKADRDLCLYKQPCFHGYSQGFVTKSDGD